MIMKFEIWHVIDMIIQSTKVIWKKASPSDVKAFFQSGAAAEATDID